MNTIDELKLKVEQLNRDFIKLSNQIDNNFNTLKPLRESIVKVTEKTKIKSDYLDKQNIEYHQKLKEKVNLEELFQFYNQDLVKSNELKLNLIKKIDSIVKERELNRFVYFDLLLVDYQICLLTLDQI
ncbi:putative protein serine/threonine kinase [Tieghemostelium lacteum]|uniref:Uncharacterized protein n=1 Tax=Tieghemostelium lacteum TaxID=361077 RepID=A0A152A1I4_TIELA|nr:putative protein serine/threonine kinase [Tieghemostelium lacteum]|eukprot:KYR00086.1 putative protein serine/threonine kinase [Tieghemostelium lacteum]